MPVQERIYEAPGRICRRMHGMRRLVTLGGIVRHFHVSQDTIYRWIRNRNMPAHQIGRLWKFKVSEVDEWVRRGGNEAEADEAEK